MFKLLIYTAFIINSHVGYISEPRISLAIARYETGHFKCKNCALDNNNLFGFKTKNGFIKYPTVLHSIHDYAMWQKRHWKPYKAKNPWCDYYEFLEWRGYCSDMENYIKMIKQL